jgi:CSLREA domain-containing protein
VARNRRCSIIVLALASVLSALLVVPSLAAAATYIVNSTHDQATKVNCETPANECTLRGAIEAANSDSTFGQIDFSGAIFKGMGGSLETIVLESELPELKPSANIAGGFCPRPGEVEACTTIEAPAGFPALVIGHETTVQNLIVKGGEVGVKVNGTSFTNVVDNQIIGSRTGVAITEGADDHVTENEIEPEWFGIEVESSSTMVTANTVTDAGRAGIVVAHHSEHDRIGGDGAVEPNTIDGSEGEGAILIYGEKSSRNEVASNFGSGNVGTFIQLRPHGFQKPNGEIAPPVFGTGLLGSASGTAEPEATVRIFTKASAEEGELASLLAKVKADSSGHWSATWAPLGAGALVTATQTSEAETLEAGTSELAAPRALVEKEETGGGGGSGTGTSTIPPTTTTPITQPAPKVPDTRITKGPVKTSQATTAKFKFTATVAGSSFECKLDNGKWAKCGSPKTYKKLKPGKHTFQVRAVAAGLKDPSPAKFKFTVKS